MFRVVAAIIKNKDNKYLLVASKKDFDQFSGCYYPPAGKLKIGENDFDCLKRELQEELGLNLLAAKFITETSGDVKEQITAWYNCIVEDYNFSINESELAQADYFNLEDIKKLNLWPATKNFFSIYIFEN